jgi:hypothetical protein
MYTDVSEDYNVYTILRALLLASSLTYYSIQKVEVVISYQ